MKKMLYAIVLISAITSLAYADAANKPQGTTMTLKGSIIDNICASSKKPEELANFVTTHTKECATAPNCMASGYSIFSDGKLYKFDKESNLKIESFLKIPENKLQVTANVIKSGDALKLISIENQK